MTFCIDVEETARVQSFEAQPEEEESMHEHVEITTQTAPGPDVNRCVRCGYNRARHSGRTQFLSVTTPGICLRGFTHTFNQCVAEGGFVADD